MSWTITTSENQGQNVSATIQCATNSSLIEVATYGIDDPALPAAAKQEALNLPGDPVADVMLVCLHPDAGGAPTINTGSATGMLSINPNGGSNGAVVLFDPNSLSVFAGKKTKGSVGLG